MRIKHRITEEPWFFERVSTTHSATCPHCSEHTYVIIQKAGEYYAMHSHVLKSSAVRFLHRWLVRADDPVCLLDFQPVRAVPGWPKSSEKKQPKPGETQFATFVNEFVIEANQPGPSTTWTMNAFEYSPPLEWDDPVPATYDDEYPESIDPNDD